MVKNYMRFSRAIHGKSHAPHLQTAELIPSHTELIWTSMPATLSEVNSILGGEVRSGGASRKGTGASLNLGYLPSVPMVVAE